MKIKEATKTSYVIRVSPKLSHRGMSTFYIGILRNGASPSFQLIFIANNSYYKRNSPKIICRYRKINKYYRRFINKIAFRNSWG